MSISLQASVTRMQKTEPWKDQCFDFTDGLKHSDLNIHFALKTSMQHKKSKRERQPIVRLFSSLSYISKRRSPNRVTRYFFPGASGGRALLEHSLEIETKMIVQCTCGTK